MRQQTRRLPLEKARAPGLVSVPVILYLHGMSDARPTPPAAAPGETRLRSAIGHAARRLREQAGLTLQDLARSSGISPGMLSKIENGATSPSLATIEALARGLHAPVTSLFRDYDETRAATFVRAGEGLKIERRGARAGHQYALLGHAPHGPLSVEPYIVTLTEKSEVFPLFQHPGLEFIHMLEGEVAYRHGAEVYVLRPGDSLFFDSDAPHGPEELRSTPIRFLTVITSVRDR